MIGPEGGPSRACPMSPPAPPRSGTECARCQGKKPGPTKGRRRPMRRFFHPLMLSAVIIGMAELTAGCGDESKNPDVQVAEKAVGVRPGAADNKTVETTRDVHVIKDTKVVDDKTGKTLSETKKSTPVKITQERREKT